MALLQRTRVLPNQRLDLPDFNRIEDFVCADFKAIQKTTLASANYVFNGFIPSGIGTNTLSIPLANSSFIVGADDGVVFIGAPALNPLATTALSPATTNYIEIFVDQDTGGADSRAFWDATANSGQGAEFSQIVDTFTFLKANLKISTSNFSGDPDKVKICEVDVNGSGVITAIRDARDLFYRLGRGSNPSFSYPWASRSEPANTVFTGADKDIKNQKQMNDALMDAVKEIKGTTYWYELAPITLSGAFRATGLSVLVAKTGGARFAWDGSKLNITDDNGSPLTSDVIAYLRLFDLSVNLGLSRQDSVNGISLADGQVLWIELPYPVTAVNYSSVGATSSNYRVANRGSVPLNDDTYWLAYREGSKLYLRGLGELKAGEARQVENETTKALAQFLGFDPEIATSVPYTHTPDGSLNYSFSSASTLVDAISANAGNINDLNTTLNGNPYDELMEVIAGVASSDNEVQGPKIAGDLISLPLDSRAGNSTEYYIVGRGALELYLNGQYLTNGDDWLDYGTSGNPSSQIQINRTLVVGDRLVFRHALVGGLVVTGGGGGGLTSLQDAYFNGSTITTSFGNPFTVTGLATKVARFLGDIEVTGVIDPKGITFSAQSSNPLGSDKGLWVDNSGRLMFSRPAMADLAISDSASGLGASAATQPQAANHTGLVLPKLQPVRINASGYLDTIDVSIETQALAVVGLISSDIADAATGLISTAGRLEDITTSATYGEVLYIAKNGTITNVQPSVGVGGFLAGDFVVRLGVVARNLTTPSLKDLIVNVSVVGQL